MNRTRTRILILALTLTALHAQDAPKPPDPELAAAKARIAYLEAKIAATEAKSKTCFEALVGVFNAADVQLANLHEPPPFVPAPKKPTK